MSGFWKGDAIAQGIANANASMQNARDSEENLNLVTRLAADLKEIKNANAANFAEKQALKVALAKIQPNHPLITNVELQERIKAAGQAALLLTDNWDAVKEAGNSFKY